MTLPVAGIRVLDFGQGVAGPYCGQLLADQGADVIKVEPPRGDWAREMGVRDANGLSGTFASVNRSKRGLCLDLTKPEARLVARRLALRADVVLESFRPGVMDRLGLGFDSLRAEHPPLVYCAITGFGESGPNADLPAGDSTMQAYGGLMSIVGEPGGEPLRVGNVVSDMLAGMNAFSGVLLALLGRSTSGAGARLGVSLLDSLVAFQAPPLTEFLLTGALPQRMGSQHPLIAPSGAVRTRDGRIVYTVLDHQWKAFCEGLGVAGLVADPRFAASSLRQRNRAALDDALAPVFLAKGSADWLVRLRELDILCAPINDYADLQADAQVRHNGLIRMAGSVPVIGNPLRGVAESVYRPPPALGEHTHDVLTDDLRMTPAEVERLLALGAAR
jgi:crotonobetainyl-CoA:carnitine CoA-transferase CaiB-like acyl-CoA transferase